MHTVRRALRPRVVRYATVGVAGTVLDLAVLTTLVEVFDTPLLIANGVSFSAAALNNYLLNRVWTFGDRQHFSGLLTAPAFLAGALVGLGISELGLLALTRLGIHYLPAKLLMVVVVFAWNYGYNTLVTFRARPYPEAADAP